MGSSSTRNQWLQLTDAGLLCRPVGRHLALLPTLLLAPSDAAVEAAAAEELLRQASWEIFGQLA